MVDFGADNSFNKSVAKIKEHYGIEVPTSSVQVATITHAKAIKKINDSAIQQSNTRKAKQKINDRSGISYIISETDGSMVPIVETAKSGKDKRKNKIVQYREARVTLAYAQGSVTPTISGTMADIDTVGKHIKHCVYEAGFGNNSHVHAVGDGALWIASQIEKQFATKATYLVDFYYVSEYLANAAIECKPDDNLAWLHDQQNKLKTGNSATVLQNLYDNMPTHGKTAISSCYNYLKNRENQLHYDLTLQKQLPIGSGEIESAHRYIVQNRIKITGAWWLFENADAMLNLSTMRHNNQWDNYWANL